LPSESNSRPPSIPSARTMFWSRRSWIGWRGPCVNLLDIVDQLRQKKASLRVLGMNLDTDTATGRMMLQALAAVAEHERASMLERQREGIAKAKAEGKYKGRAPTAMTKAGEVEKLLAAGVNPTDVARKLGIGRSSVYRAMRERKIKRVAGIARG